MREPNRALLQFYCRVSWPILIARSGYGQTAPPLLPFSSPHQGEGDSFLAAAARPEPDRHASARRGAGAVSARTRPASLWRRIWWLPCQARVGGGRLLPSYHASRLRARVIVSRSLRLRPCVVPPRASSCHGRAAAAVPSTGGLSDRYCPHQTPASSALPFHRSGRLLAKLKSVVCFLASSRSPNCLDVVYLGSFHV